MKLHLDTHVALWLVAGEKKRLRPVAAVLRKAESWVSPIVVVEMEILREIGRISAPVDEVLDILVTDYGVREAPGELAEVTRQARHLGWTRDPFDRLIVAHALAAGVSLLTADERILAHCKTARWA